MSEWAQIDGYVAFKMMEAAAELADLKRMFEQLEYDVANGKASALQAMSVRRHCNRLADHLDTVRWSLDEAEKNAAMAEKLKVVK